MALPLAPAPKSDHITYTGWAGITVRVAWTLVALGVRVRPDVLRDAREHVLLQLEPRMLLPQAEDRAGEWTRVFVERARGRRLGNPWPQDAQMPISGRWWRALERSLTPLSRVVLRQHYANHRSLKHLEGALRVDRVALETTRSGLREVVRQAALADCLPVEDWEPERLDRLISRLAGYAPGPCPPPVEVVEGCHADHVAVCVRCDRTQRLVRSGILDLDDLLPPTLGTWRPRHAEVLALHFHPEARSHRASLVAELSAPCFPLGDDMLLVDWSTPEPVTSALILAAEVGQPPRSQVRGVLVAGAGVWSQHGLLGGLPDDAGRAVRGASWGEVEPIGELPSPLPDPPSAKGAWTLAGLAVVLAAAAVFTALPETVPEAKHPLEIAFTSGRGGIWTAFDVDEGALVTVVREHEGVSEVVWEGRTPADKARWATGDGSYRMHSPGDALLVVSSSHPVGEFLDNAPLDQLAARIVAAQDGVDLQIHRRADRVR